MTDESYRDAVMKGGNEKPWKGQPNLKHADIIDPNEVELDEVGNILDMPLLRRKPCFGRPETFLRHGDRVRRVPNKWGKLVDSMSHQCGACPQLTWQSCAKVVMKRVVGNPGIHEALRAWQSDCDLRHSGDRIYVEESGRLWGAFKQAIVDRGPFTNSNDEVLLERAAADARAQKAKWRISKAAQREKARRKQRADRMLPSRQFILNAVGERNERENALYAVLGMPGQHKSRSMVPEAHRAATAAITANAWLIREILIESNRYAGSGTVARYMVQLGLNGSKRLAPLKARMQSDLNRGYHCEQDGIWSRFDRNKDLDDYDAPDDAADDLAEPIVRIEDLLTYLEPAGTAG